MAKSGKNEKTIKTSVKLPHSLWRAAHIRALDEGTELQVIVARALDAYLKKGEKNEG